MYMDTHHARAKGHGILGGRFRGCRCAALSFFLWSAGCSAPLAGRHLPTWKSHVQPRGALPLGFGNPPRMRMTVTDSLRILFWWPDRCFVDALRRCSRVVVATERHPCVASSACVGEAWPQRVCAQRLKGRARRLVAVAARTMLASFTSCEGVECWATESADGACL